MIKQITVNWLKKVKARSKSIIAFKAQKETDPIKIIKKLMLKKSRELIKQKYDDDSLSWANWFIPRLMNRKQYISYAVYAAEQVIEIYEKKYPDDKRPREAIEAVKKCLKNNTKKNRNAAAYAAVYAAYAAANAAADAAMKIKILKYGLKLLQE